MLMGPLAQLLFFRSCVVWLLNKSLQERCINVLLPIISSSLSTALMLQIHDINSEMQNTKQHQEKQEIKGKCSIRPVKEKPEHSDLQGLESYLLVEKLSDRSEIFPH